MYEQPAIRDDNIKRLLFISLRDIFAWAGAGQSFIPCLVALSTTLPRHSPVAHTHTQHSSISKFIQCYSQMCEYLYNIQFQWDMRSGVRQLPHVIL